MTISNFDETLPSWTKILYSQSNWSENYAFIVAKGLKDFDLLGFILKIMWNQLTGDYRQQ